MRFPLDVPVLTDGVVTLRAHTVEDADAMVQMCTDPEMRRWTAVPVDYTHEHAVGFARDVMRVGWEEKDHRGWAIEAPGPDGEPRFAGNIDVRGRPVADIGYVLHPSARGRGLMTRAIRLALGWCFTDGGVEIVHWRAHVGNEPSLRTAWASGFTLHGTTPGLLYERERVLDAWTASVRFGDDLSPRTTWLGCPVLEDGDLRLRPYLPADERRIVEACADDVTQQWLAFLPQPYTLASARTFLAQRIWQRAVGDGVSWCVADRATGRMLANVSVFRRTGLDRTAAEVGYWAHPDARGRGVMTRAVGMLVQHALASIADGGVGLRRLELLAAAGNTSSNAVARANGFEHVGTMRAAEALGDGTYDDLLVYDLLV